MKSLTIAGNLGKDAVLRRTQGGDSILSFGVAVEERRGQDKRTIWIDCSMFGKRGEALERFLTKGSKVAVSGDMSTREHEGKTYITLKADNVTLLGGGQEGGQRQERVDHNAIGGKNDGYGAGGRPSYDDSEIPFAPCIL